MNCLQFKDQLFEFIDGALDEKTMGDLRQHMKICKPCDELYDQEMNIIDEPLTELFDEINDMELKDETIQEITTKLLDLEIETKRDKVE